MPSAPNPKPRLLIADDQPHILEALRLLLKPEGFQVDSASSPAEILIRLSEAE